MFIINLADRDYVKSQIQSFISKPLQAPSSFLPLYFFIEEKNVGYDEILGLPPPDGEWLICSKVYAIMKI